VNKFTIYPRLIRSEAIEIINQINSLRSDQILELKNEDLNLENYIYSSIGGRKITEEKIKEIRENIKKIAIDNNFPNTPSTMNTQKFDRESTMYLFENLNISPNEASKNEIWNFISCILLPDIVYWRYFFKENKINPTKDALNDRYLGGRRNCFQKLWWRALVFRNLNNNGNKYEFLLIFNGDDFRELEERTSIYGNINLCREVARNYNEIKNKFTEKLVNRDLFRDVLRRIIRYMPWLSFEILTQRELQTTVKEIFVESLEVFKVLVPENFIDNRQIFRILDNEFKPSVKDVPFEFSIHEGTTTLSGKLKNANYLNEELDNISLRKLKKKEIINKIERIFQKKISCEILSGATFITEDHTRLIQVLISARYNRKNQKYWFTLTSKHILEMEDAEDSYIVLGLTDKEDFFMIPYSWFKEREEFFHKKFYDDYYKTHLFIEDEYGENYIVRSKDNEIPYESIESFKYPKEQKNKEYSPITEEQLYEPALKIIQDYGNNGITTSELVKELRELLKPQGADTDLLKGRADDKFSQRVRNLKSHRKLDSNNNISFINNKYYWLKKNIQKIDPNRNLIIPEDVDWRKKHFISIIKEKIHTSGGKKAINQWKVLKKFDNLSIYNYQTEAMNNTMSDRTNSLYHNSRDGINWWDQELHFCVLKNIVLIKDSNKEIIKF